VLVTSCEKNINLSVKNQTPKLVVDGSIENGMPPVISLSTSLNYFSTITPEELSASFVHNAKVTVSDGVHTVQLKEYSYTDTSGYALYYYTPDTVNTRWFVGAFNTSYNLTIQTPDTVTYTATTTIPTIAKTCDSLWWLPAPTSVNNDSLVKVMGLFTDPKGLGNYIRVFTKTNGEPFYPESTSVFDDEFTDGTTYNFQVLRSYNRNDQKKQTDSDYGLFYHGDTMTLKFCNIDKATFDFWNTWEFSYQSNGNPFSSPVTVLSNISNNGLGAFCGYAAQYKTLIIPK
jgi:hypothetical protein